MFASDVNSQNASSLPKPWLLRVTIWNEWHGERFEWGAQDPPPYTNTHPTCDPSHLTIADGRGEGEVGVCAGGWLSDLWMGPRPGASYKGLCDHQLVSREPWALNPNYPVGTDADGNPEWWNPNPSDLLDCAAVPHAMTWRAA